MLGGVSGGEPALVTCLLGLLAGRMMTPVDLAGGGGGERDERACQAVERLEGKVGPRHRDRLAAFMCASPPRSRSRIIRSPRGCSMGWRSGRLGWGWAPSRVLVIDEDLGHSASGADARPGFQRLVSEVGLDHVGIVLGIEMSRLARSGREWHQLLELCALSGTLLGIRTGSMIRLIIMTACCWG